MVWFWVSLTYLPQEQRQVADGLGGRGSLLVLEHRTEGQVLIWQTFGGRWEVFRGSNTEHHLYAARGTLVAGAHLYGGRRTPARCPSAHHGPPAAVCSSAQSFCTQRAGVPATDALRLLVSPGSDDYRASMPGSHRTVTHKKKSY